MIQQRHNVSRGHDRHRRRVVACCCSGSSQRAGSRAHNPDCSKLLRLKKVSSILKPAQEAWFLRESRIEGGTSIHRITPLRRGFLLLRDRSGI